MKGIAILLVIFHHSICDFPINIKANIPSFIDVFITISFMHIFFVVSGFLFKAEYTFTALLKKKVSRLLIPYLTFGFLNQTSRIIFGSITRSTPPSYSEVVLRLLTGQTYWFLYSLLVIMIIAYWIITFANKLKTNNFISIVFSLVLYYISQYCLPESNLLTSIKSSFQYLPYFLFGYALKTYYPQIKRHFIKYPTDITIICFIFITIISIYHNKISNNLCYYFIPIIGVLGTYTFSLIAIKYLTMLLTPCLEYFGKYSLQYYLNHMLISLPCFYFAYFLKLASWASLFLIFFAILTLSFFMLTIENKIKIFQYICGINSNHCNKLQSS